MKTQKERGGLFYFEVNIRVYIYIYKMSPKKKDFKKVTIPFLSTSLDSFNSENPQKKTQLHLLKLQQVGSKV